MHSAAAIEKKYGLEKYPDKPAELNDGIFHLLLLQEATQKEQVRKRKVNAINISVKRSVSGKFIAACLGNAKYRYAVETALKASTCAVAVFQRSRFIHVLHDMGIPDESIT
jgi:hypothetical protein